MILESAVLDVKPEQTRQFEAAFSEARHIISASPKSCACQYPALIFGRFCLARGNSGQ
jgi:hypothetical protein